MVEFLPFSLEMEQRICDRPSTSWREQRPDRGWYRWRRTTHVTREGEGVRVEREGEWRWEGGGEGGKERGEREEGGWEIHVGEKEEKEEGAREGRREGGECMCIRERYKY